MATPTQIGIVALLLTLLATAITLAVVLSKSSNGSASLINLPSRFALKYNIQPLHGENETYSGELFVDGALSMNAVQHIVIMKGSNNSVNNIFYDKGVTGFTSTVNGIYREGCLKGGDVPPLNNADSAISSVSTVSQADLIRGWGFDLAQTLSSECIAVNGKWLHIVFAQTEYILCIANGALHRVASDGFLMRITAFQADMPFSNIGANVPASLRTQCTSVVQSAEEINMISLQKDEAMRAAVSDGKHQLFSSYIAFGLPRHPRHFNTPVSLFSELQQEPVADKCVFLHGMGVLGTNDQWFTENYWHFAKGVAQSMCKESIFPQYETVKSGSYDSRLIYEYNKIAMDAQGPNDRVFAHSMGNLIMANAILKAKAENRALPKFIGLAGPNFGSTGANFASDICRSNGEFAQMLTSLSLFKNYCEVATQSIQTCDRRDNPNRIGVPCTAAERAVVGSRMRGNLCGVSGWGLASTNSPGLFVLAAVVETYNTWLRTNEWFTNIAPSDGMVNLASCKSFTDAVGGKTYGSGSWWSWWSSTPNPISSPYSEMSINHYDDMFASGDGWYSDDRKPVSWLRQRISDRSTWNS